MPLTLTSPVFAEGETIPTKYARDGENLMPPLKWTGIPGGTQSFVLIVEDPDAPKGIFRHCAVYNIPADREGLPESIDTSRDNALSYAINDFGNAHYDGPEPPIGDDPHHYHFRLAALDVPRLAIPAKAGAQQIWHEARKHVIEEAELVGIYQR
ncbi:YbhB/YbcL family Raf kinase inhibitor-like protein [Phyllobacterium salinisoli]|uniref:YbhB/YbcL family Raf kinase inhibitor-like protein n=1 Tax=Phyllobacterium salinisoli TaxID=1899321 RepID=A0A368K8I9_9HYPH|nr:YbhB/YbcL family Raf kinase inhibitor-like protein [Phyllobacterium salinisoli]RCS25676.1 YbhB/YbcL family Raf kinase inhibitor-like protein [Phyllobacterium salinisoli]